MEKKSKSKGDSEKKKADKFDVVGYCGNNCTKCDIYIATTTDDKKIREKIIQETEFYTGEKINGDQVYCLGCRNPKSNHREHLGIICYIHECAEEKKPISCAHCSYFACTKIEKHFNQFSLKPAKNIIKAGKKLKRLGEYGENLEDWLKKEKKI